MREIIDNCSIFLIPPILFLITGVSLGLFSLIKGKRQYENILFALICFWASLTMPVFISHHIFKGNIPLIMNIERTIHLLYVFGPLLLVLFAHSIVGKKNRIIEASTFAVCAALSLTVFTDHYFYGMWEYKWGYIAKGGIFLQIFGMFSILAIIYVFVLSLKKLKTDLNNHTRLKIKYIMFAILSIGILTLGNMPALNGIDIYPPGNFAFIPIIFIAWGIFRYDVIKINLYAKRRISGTIVKIFVFTGLLITIPVFIWALGNYSLSHITGRIIPYGLPPLISFIYCIFISFLALRMGENRKDSVVFSIVVFVYACLSADIFINCIITDPEIGLKVSRLSHLLVVFIPAIGMHLIRIVTSRKSEQWLLYANYITCFVLLLFSQTPYYLQGMYVYSWGFFARKAVLFDIMSIVSALTLAYNIFILLSAYKNNRDRYFRHRFLFLFIGSISIAIMSLGNIPAMNGYDIYPTGNFIFIPVTFFAIALFRHNLSELVHFAGTVFYFSSIAIAVFFTVFILTFYNPESNKVLFTLVSVSGIIIFDFFLRRFRNIITGREFKRLKIAFENLNDRLCKVRSNNEIAECISISIFTNLASSKCAVLIMDENTGQYTGTYFTNSKEANAYNFPESERASSLIIYPENPLLEYINTTRLPILQEELEDRILNSEMSVELNDPLRHAELILPVFFEKKLSAIILLGNKKDGTIYSGTEKDFLYQVGINLGPHLENALILHRLEDTLEMRTRNLRESEGKYRHFIENTSEIIYKTDRLGSLIYYNPSFKKMFEYDDDEILTLNFIDLIPEENRKAESDFYNRQSKDKVDFTIHELPVQTKSGKTYWVEQNVKSIKDLSGNIVEFDIIVHNITERKAAEDALKESEERYRYLIENASELIYKTNRDGIITYANQVTIKLFGFDEIELLKTSYADVVHPDYVEELRNLFISEFIVHKKSECYAEYPCINKNGETVWIGVNIKHSSDNIGRNREYHCIGRDITKIKTAENALRESETRYQQLMDNISDCVFICESNGHFKYLNKATTRLFDISEQEIIGKHFLSVIHPDHREKQRQFYNDQINEKIETTYCEFMVSMKNRKPLWVGQTVRMIKNNHGEIEFYGITRDISSIKKAEESRKELEEAKTRFFANISHEIRTPLTLMLGPIESVLQGDYGMEVGTDFFRNLHRNTISLLRLVNNLLDFSKIDAGKMSLRVHEIDVVRFARYYIKYIYLACKSRNITLDISSSSDSIMLYFDPERMDKVFMNLLSNALKFTGDGGKISISIIEDADNCIFNISDTGEGIPEESIHSIFDRFTQADTTTTRKHEGSGIGLALVRELVELHAGSISAESRHIDKYPENHGSTFTISLQKGLEHLKNRPNIKIGKKSSVDHYIRDYRMIGIKEIEELKISTSMNEVHGTKDNIPLTGNEKTILIVDDNEDMRNFLKVLLHKQYRVALAENGANGIETARMERPDLIVTDVMMPVMNGFDMTSIIKNDEQLKTIPVIMLTADTDLMNKVAGLEYGADDYLHKPFNSIELMTRISSLLKNYEYQQIISRRNEEIERELEVARLLQQKLLPSSMPEVPGYYAHAIYIPMDKIGGDFYSIESRDGFLDIFIADVAGHGLPGAFLATITKIALENITNRAEANNILCDLNNVILHHTVQSNFVSAFFSIIDIKTKVMRYSSAGHNPPILYRRKNNEFIELTAKGRLLGLFSEITLEEKTIQLEPGDRIVFYTDGITECNNSSTGMYEEKRFMELIQKHSADSPENFSQALIKDLEIYNNGKCFEDDITMVVLDIL